MIWHGVIQQCIIQNMNSMTHHLWHIPTPTCFSTEVASSGSHCNKCISQHANRFSPKFTYFVKPYGSTLLIKFCLRVFVVVNSFCLLNICKFYVIHTAHVLIIDLPSNTCTLWYTIYDIHQLLYVSALRCHSQAVTLTKLYKPCSPVFCCQVSAIVLFKWRMHWWLLGTLAKLQNCNKKKNY